MLAHPSADHPDSKNICISSVGDNDLKQEEEKVNQQMELQVQEKLQFQKRYEDDCKQKRLVEKRKEEEEKVRHQKEMEALKVQEQLENQKRHENDAEQKCLAEIHNEVTETNPNKINELVGGMETIENTWADAPSTTTTTITLQPGSPQLRCFSSEEALKFLIDRWEAVMRTDHERLVMYEEIQLEPGSEAELLLGVFSALRSDHESLFMLSEPEAEASDPDVEEEPHDDPDVEEEPHDDPDVEEEPHDDPDVLEEPHDDPDVGEEPHDDPDNRMNEATINTKDIKSSEDTEKIQLEQGSEAELLLGVVSALRSHILENT